MNSTRAVHNPAILYADNALLVIDKPAGTLSLPDGYDPEKPHLRSLLEPRHGRLWIVHRLDKDTSGVMILARTAQAHRSLNLQFSNRQVAKSYHALVQRNPAWDQKTVDAPLRANVGRRKRTTVDHRRGKPAITHFRVLERFGNRALIEANPQTGRTHQIRAHLYQLGLSILADPLYGSGKPSNLIDRLALHAFSLTLTHPETRSRISFQAPYPADFSNARCQLKTPKP